MTTRTFLIVAALCALSFFAGTLWAAKPVPVDLASHIFRAAETRTSTGTWGSIHIYTSDAASSFGAASVLTAELEFLPGKQLQPPHLHPEEEFQFVIEGSGTWSLNGQEYPLKAGDLMYTRPWDWHGIRNSGEVPLKFFVFKWRAKGVAAPERPAG
jgi:mannose-6-phosphate isomerase-like protein (cupin superfamily)